ncbi:hypothetical protein [Meiothermus sp. CFH 77666]|nr:hypothetical protein [Meiothermus sp. CFH 77666]
MLLRKRDTPQPEVDLVVGVEVIDSAGVRPAAESQPASPSDKG